ncbi:hypothetical protein [Corynebacterium glyciniphilum]|uniref:Putative membrane protein n=1 Tax=Corynebacterium glyciniphilum AJ 3170 TaxID=1404245 RepID=X5DN48_9CORY|nr:hypothetical protein [Corynebacterium glyciniphilum]AHW64568.1 Putative membrane protein [Corynebacterium glyciniphilum AJ 3170]
MHLTPQHWLLAFPVLALVLTPVFPFINTPTLILGLPVMVLWVGGWAILTTVILGLLYRHEPELADEIPGEYDTDTTTTEATA